LLEADLGRVSIAREKLVAFRRRRVLWELERSGLDNWV
jgi:hypothetical protein